MVVSARAAAAVEAASVGEVEEIVGRLRESPEEVFQGLEGITVREYSP